MTEEEKKAKELEIAKSLENKLTDLVAAAAEKSFKDATPLATFNAAIEEVKKEIGAIGGENGQLADVKKSLDDVISATTKFMKDFESKKEKGFNGQENGLSKAIDDVLDGESYKSFVNGNGQRRTGEMQMKAVSIESNYTGDNLLTQQSNIVAYNPQSTKINMRDVVRTIPGDPEFPSFTWQEIFEIDREAAAVSENGSLPVSSFKLINSLVASILSCILVASFDIRISLLVSVLISRNRWNQTSEHSISVLSELLIKSDISFLLTEISRPNIASFE